MIHGVEIKNLSTHTDERGFFREVIRVSDPIFPEGFGQWSHTMSYQGVAKAWHVHQKQVDWWYVAVGTIRAALYDTRPDSPTHGETQELLMGDGQPALVLKIPPGGPRLSGAERTCARLLHRLTRVRWYRRGAHPPR